MKVTNRATIKFQRRIHIIRTKMRKLTNRALQTILITFIALILVNLVDIAITSGHTIPTVEAKSVDAVLPEQAVLVATVVSPPKCELSFKSNNSGQVTPPTWFVERVSKYSCKQQQILTRIAYYESSWNESAVNKHNKYAKGLYQILPSTLNTCKRNGADTLEDCVLWIVGYKSSWFESITRNRNSFKDLI